MYSFIRILIMKKLKINEGFLKAFTIILLLVIATLGITLYKKQEEITRTSENSFNMAFYELVDYVQNVEAYLAKSLVSTTSERGAETLTHLWREANLAQSCLSMLPVESQELENTEKFLNQVSDYSYSPAYAFICYIDANYVASTRLHGISTDTVMGHHGVGIFWNVCEWTLD